jgi:hypothetical protein
MRPSRRLGTLVAAASLATATAGVSPAHAYVDAGYANLPVSIPHTTMSRPAHHDSADWPLAALGGAALLGLSAAVVRRTTRPRAHTRVTA